jgi:hypothetical protein
MTSADFTAKLIDVGMSRILEGGHQADAGKKKLINGDIYRHGQVSAAINSRP